MAAVNKYLLKVNKRNTRKKVHLLKVNNKDTRTTSATLENCLQENSRINELRNTCTEQVVQVDPRAYHI